MVTDDKYRMLKDQYNLAVAKAKDLNEQLLTRDRQYKVQNSQAVAVEKAVRQLCSEILAKDKDEMVLGEEYYWDKIEVKELIQKAGNVYREYNKDRSDVLNRCLDLLNERDEQIASQEEQIQIMIEERARARAEARRNPGKQEAPPENEPAQEGSDEENVRSEVEAEQKKRQAIANNEALKRAAEGGIQIEVTEEENDPPNGGVSDKTANEISKFNASIKPLDNSMPVHQNNKSINRKNAQKQRQVETYIMELKSVTDAMDENAWKIIELIGTNGFSRFEDIERSFSGTGVNTTRIRTALKSLVDKQAVISDIVKLPIHNRMSLYKMNDVGIKLYKMRHDGASPVISEWERIVSEHDNVEHGYGIWECGVVIQNMDNIASVDIHCRSHEIKLENGGSYIPDIMAVSNDANPKTAYVEYERGTHDQKDFNEKCNKMMRVSQYMIFVVPNKETLVDKIIPKLDKWIATKSRSLLNRVVIKGTTLVKLNKLNLFKTEDWDLLYECKKSLSPVRTPS